MKRFLLVCLLLLSLSGCVPFALCDDANACTRVLFIGNSYTYVNDLPAAFARLSNTGAAPLFFITWAHRGGFPENGMNDFETMQAQINKGYTGVARELNVPFAPVGSAWFIATRKYPQLNLWQEDGSHPNKEGTYLAACIFYAAIFQESLEGLNYHANLSDETALILQTVASQVVFNGQ